MRRAFGDQKKKGNAVGVRGYRCSFLPVVFAALGVLLIWCGGFGEPVASDQAGDAAVQFIVREIGRGTAYVRAVGALPSTQVTGPAMPLLDPIDGTTLGYVYELVPVGYLVVTSDTQLTPVIAFSYTSNFSWDEHPDNLLLHMLRHDLALRLDAADAGGIAPGATASNEADWQALISPPLEPQGSDKPGADPPGNGGTTVYGPWLTSAWSQGAPWNDDCPIDPDTSERCVVGCTATALGQVLNYWQYPTSIAFPESADYITTTREISIDASTADFTSIDYNGSDPSDAVMAAVSYAAGVSLEMNYTSTGSGAHMAYWSHVLAGTWSPWTPPDQRWGYASADLRTYAWSGWGAPYYTDETSFYTQLSTSMTQARPAGVWVSESGGGGGHTIVADGWQSGGRTFHLNYGWSGSTDGWYAMPSMGAGYGFVEAAIVNIYPTATNYTLTTQVTGSGTVSNLPTGTSYSEGTHVLVTPTPSAGSVFSHWEGDLSGMDNPGRVILDGNKTVTAVFRSTVWSDDMEPGTSWTATVGPNTCPGGSLWHITTTKSHSATNSWWYGQEGTGDYATGSRSCGILTSPVIDVSAYDSVNVAFWHWRHVWSYTDFASDKTYAQYSLDSGGWTQFWYKDSLDASEEAWSQVNTAVSTAGVSNLQVRFVFDTWYSNYYDNFPGWYIDDVALFLDTNPPDTTPPTPDPMTWDAVPSVTAATTISMTATTATDPSGVEYSFEETSGNSGGTSSGWQDNPTYSDDGLSSDTQYCYRVKARDKSANLNETGWSATQCATTGPADTAAVFRVTADGTVLSDATVYSTSFQTGAADVAEWVSVSEPVTAGAVVELDPDNPGSYRLSSAACSPWVAGVISTEPGVVLGHAQAFSQRALLALVGIIPTRVTDEGGPILPGDLLVASSTPGHAMRWSGSGPCLCALVGKALEPMTEDNGIILVLLTAH